MQPYFLPYLGYFQMVNAVDRFVFYDDVNYIKGGWINRNFLGDGLFTIPLIKSSSFKKINEIEVNWSSREIIKLEKRIKQNYSKSPSFKAVFQIIESIFDERPKLISDLCSESIVKFSKYLNIDTEFITSSELKYKKLDDKESTLIGLCKQLNASHYINPIGGIDLYSKKTFKDHSIKLSFIKGMASKSILDVCMQNEKEQIILHLDKYELV